MAFNLESKEAEYTSNRLKIEISDDEIVAYRHKRLSYGYNKIFSIKKEGREAIYSDEWAKDVSVYVGEEKFDSERAIRTMGNLKEKIERMVAQERKEYFEKYPYPMLFPGQVYYSASPNVYFYERSADALGSCMEILKNYHDPKLDAFFLRGSREK